MWATPSFQVEKPFQKSLINLQSSSTYLSKNVKIKQPFK